MTNENELSVYTGTSNNAVTSGARMLWNNGLFLFYLSEVFSKLLYLFESYDWARNCKEPVGQGCSETQIYAGQTDNFENSDSSHVVVVINRSPVSGTSSYDENSLVVGIKGDCQLNFLIYCRVALMRGVSTYILQAIIMAN